MQFTFMGEFASGKADGVGLCTLAVNNGPPTTVRGRFSAGRINGVAQLEYVANSAIFVGNVVENEWTGVGELKRETITLSG